MAADVRLTVSSPSAGEQFHQGTSPVRVQGIVKASAGWLTKQGLPAWKVKPASELEELDLVPAGAVEFETDESVVEFKALELNVDGESVTAWLGPRRSETHAEFFAEITRRGLPQGSHELTWSLAGSPAVAGTVSFQMGPPIQAQSIPTISGGYGIDPLPEGVPDHLDPDEVTPGRMREIHRRLPPRKRPSRADEDEIIERVRRRLDRMRAAFPDKGWVVIPPTPPLSDEWKVVPFDAYEWWRAMRYRYRRFRRARRRTRDNPHDDQAWRDRSYERRQLRGMTRQFGRENGCCCGCIVCIRVIRLTGGQFAAPPNAAAVRRVIAAANGILSQCCIALELEGAVRSLALRNAEFRRWFNTPRIELVDREALLRTLQRRSPNTFSNTCVNVLLASARNGSLGPNGNVPGVGTGGYVAGATGQLTFPGTTNGSVPSHVVIETGSFTGHTLAHEMGHVFCQWDEYGNLDDVFPQPAGQDRSQRARGAYRAAQAWKRAMDARIQQERQNHPNLSGKEAADRVFGTLGRQDILRWLKVYDLMALGDDILCDRCRSMCACIERNYPQFCR